MGFFVRVSVCGDDINYGANYHHCIIKKMNVLIWRVSMIGLQRKDNRWGVVLDYNNNLYLLSMLC